MSKKKAIKLKIVRNRVEFLVFHQPYVVSFGKCPEKSRDRVCREIRAAKRVGADGYVFHLARGLNPAEFMDFGVFEFVAHKDLEKQLEKLPKGARLCLDSAHLWACGLNLKSFAELDSLRAELERRGLSVLCLHVNDSLSELGGKLDRHWHLGEGKIGLKGLENFVKVFDGIPAILETPKTSIEDDIRNLEVLRGILR